MPAAAEPQTPGTGLVDSWTSRGRDRLLDAARVAEVAGVLAAPAIVYWILRLRGMVLPGIDQSIHTSFIVDPRDVFLRYAKLYARTSSFREGERPGFLVPARLAYLLFGAVPGFFVFRYALALVAIGPVYLLLRRLYGRWAGFAGIALVLSNPVIVTAWGSDYPDSAVVSYLLGALALLALSWHSRHTVLWLALSAALLTLAVWSLGVAVPILGAWALAYVGVRMTRQRSGLARHLSVAGLCAVLVTGLLAVSSHLLIGQFNFITPTIQSAEFLSRPAQVRAFHSSSWAWAPYDPWLLVPPAITLAFFGVFARRLRGVSSANLFLGLASLLVLALFFYLQFFGSEEFLEAAHFSDSLWASVLVLLAVILAALLQPVVRSLTGRDVRASRAGALAGRIAGVGASALPTMLVLALPLLNEAVSPHLPRMKWGSAALYLVAPLLAAVIVGRLATSWSSTVRDLGLTCCVMVLLASVLLLTVVRGSPRRRLPGTVKPGNDPAALYAGALGGSDARSIDAYSVTTRLPTFVGPPAYPEEQLLIWWPAGQSSALSGPVGFFHAAINQVTPSFPELDARGARWIADRRAAQVLLMSLTGRGFSTAVASLTRYEPLVLRRGVLSDGAYHLHLWLVELRRFLGERPG